MRSLIWVVSLALMFAAYPVLGEDDNRPLADDERSIEILYTSTPPILDGYINDLEWQTQFTISYFDALDGRSFREIYPEAGSDEEFTDQASDLAVTFYMLYDDNYLYFAANVTDDSIIVDSGSTFWRDDGVELLLDGAHDMDEDQRADDPWPGFEDGTTLLAVADGSYFHDYSIGSPYERTYGSNEAWFASTRTSSANNYYIVEMRIRLDSISSPLPGSTIGLNIGVNDDDTGGDSKTALKWNGTTTGPNEVPTFKNETLWGTAYLKPYVQAELPPSIHVDEDEEISISSNLTIGNHPLFDSLTNFTWTLPLFDGSSWNNHTSYGPDFVYTFYEPRSYYVLIMEVTGPSGVKDKASTYVYVHDVTIPLISSEDVLALEEEPFTFILNVTDNFGLSHIEWSLFDNGWFNSSTPIPVFDHTFVHPGNYTLHYIAFDLENNSASGSSIITVLDNAPPLISAGLEDLMMNTSQIVQLEAPYSFDDTSEGPSTDLIYDWYFYGPFGGFPFQGASIDLELTVPGHYNATLMVIDHIGLFSTTSFNVTVTDNTPPIPAFFLPQEYGELTVLQLNSSGSIDNDPLFHNGSAYNWTVELAGKTSWTGYFDGPLVNVSFPFPGMATVTLNMTDPSGNNRSLTKNVQVLDISPPSARLWFDDEIVDQGEAFFINITGTLENVGLISVHYTVYAVTSGGNAELFTSPFFGIRLGDTSVEEFHTIPGLWISIDDPGTYLINVTLEDSSGLKDNASRTIKIRDSIPPVASINRTVVYVRPGEYFSLSASSSSDELGPLSYLWLIGNDTRLGEEQEIGYAFMDKGEYNITLKVTDSGGNSDWTSCRVVVADPERTGGDGTDYTMVYVIWSITGMILLFGFLVLFIWARKKRTGKAEVSEE